MLFLFSFFISLFFLSSDSSVVALSFSGGGEFWIDNNKKHKVSLLD